MVETRRGHLRQRHHSSSSKQPAAEPLLLLDVDVADLILQRLVQGDALALLGTQQAYGRTHAMLRRFVAAYKDGVCCRAAQVEARSAVPPLHATAGTLVRLATAGVPGQLHKACSAGDFLWLQVLMETGIDVNHDEGAGFTGLMAAAQAGHEQVTFQVKPSTSYAARLYFSFDTRSTQRHFLPQNKT